SSPRGNAEKYLSYREAWARIKAAQGHGFYLEAVTIEESIISDRLIRYLLSVNAIELKDDSHRYPPFGQLIQLWKQERPEPITSRGVDNLQEAVDHWRRHRNNIVHGLVKSNPGTPTEDIDDFLWAARQAAAEGEKLAKAVSQWCAKVVPRSPRETRTKTSEAVTSASISPEEQRLTRLLGQLGFSAPIHVRGRTSVADLFKQKERCGVYVLEFATGELYAGKARDVTRRFVQHSKTHDDIERLAFMRVSEAELDTAERSVIKRLEEGKPLRNITFTRLPAGETDFDLVMSHEEQMRWRADLSFQDLSGPRLVDPVLRRKYSRRYRQFERLGSAERVSDVLRTYVDAAIPVPRRSEVAFWAVTCLPSVGMPARININWQEVFNVHGHDADLWCSIFMAASPFDEWSQERSDKLYERYLTLQPTDHWYKPGGEDQLNFYIRADEVESFVTDPEVLPAIREFNLRLMRRGPCIYGRYHCMDLVDRLLEEKERGEELPAAVPT
ncbi:MAG: GIY-YIG nuclease family protein, partial [Rubrobacter sp.]|nr:GIY-YIG nuclease family protein [Rubrobacter sp.]